METHPPERTLTLVRTGASKLEINSPSEMRELDFKSLTKGSVQVNSGLGWDFAQLKLTRELLPHPT